MKNKSRFKQKCPVAERSLKLKTRISDKQTKISN